MSTLTIEIDLDSDAFKGNMGNEVSRILRQFAAQVEHAQAADIALLTQMLQDSAGNRVGSADFDIFLPDSDENWEALDELSKDEIRDVLENVLDYVTYQTDSHRSLLDSLQQAVTNGFISLTTIKEHIEASQPQAA